MITSKDMFMEEREREEHGSINAEPTPISMTQIGYIETLLERSTLSEEKRMEIYQHATAPDVTMEEGGKIIDYLLLNQPSPLDSIKNGNLLGAKETNKAAKQAVDRDTK